MLPHMNYIILANMQTLTFYKVVWQQVREVVASNSSFLCRSFLNLTAEKKLKTGALLPKLLQKIKVAYFFLRHGVYLQPVACKASGLELKSTLKSMFAGLELGWRRSIVVRTLVSACKLSLSCARLLAG